MNWRIGDCDCIPLAGTTGHSPAEIRAFVERWHVARLLDGGVTDDGRPYLVMEYVDGVTVKDLLHYGSLRSPTRLLDGLAGALHPVTLADGRIMFSTLESQGIRSEISWGIWTIHPDGTNWNPLVSAFDPFSAPNAFHFQSQLSDGNLIVQEYYNQNNSGFGAYYKMPVPPEDGYRMGPAYPDDPRNPKLRAGRNDKRLMQTEWREESLVLAGTIGAFVIVYAISLWESLNWAVRIFAEVEARMTSVERLKYYASLEAEQEDVGAPLGPPRLGADGERGDDAAHDGGVAVLGHRDDAPTRGPPGQRKPVHLVEDRPLAGRRPGPRGVCWAGARTGGPAGASPPAAGRPSLSRRPAAACSPGPARSGYPAGPARRPPASWSIQATQYSLASSAASTRSMYSSRLRPRRMDSRP